MTLNGLAETLQRWVPGKIAIPAGARWGPVLVPRRRQRPRRGAARHQSAGATRKRRPRARRPTVRRRIDRSFLEQTSPLPGRPSGSRPARSPTRPMTTPRQPSDGSPTRSSQAQGTSARAASSSCAPTRRWWKAGNSPGSLTSAATALIAELSASWRRSATSDNTRPRSARATRPYKVVPARRGSHRFTAPTAP